MREYDRIMPTRLVHLVVDAADPGRLARFWAEALRWEVGDEEPDEDSGMCTGVTVEITGLSLYTHVGVGAAEREVGQRLLFDITIDVGESAATETDRVEDTVDYAEVCQLVALVSQQRTYHTLERLCTAIADRLIEDFAAEAVWVKAAKPEPPIPLPVEQVSVEVWREPPE